MHFDEREIRPREMTVIRCGRSPEIRGKACDAVDAPARPVGRLQLQHVVVLGVKVVQADDAVLLRGGGQGVVAGPADLKVKEGM